MAEKQRREGDPLGAPEVRFDKTKGQNYHLNVRGEKVYDEVPEGYRFGDDGILVPKSGKRVDPLTGLLVSASEAKESEAIAAGEANRAVEVT